MASKMPNKMGLLDELMGYGHPTVFCQEVLCINVLQ